MYLPKLSTDDTSWRITSVKTKNNTDGLPVTHVIFKKPKCPPKTLHQFAEDGRPARTIVIEELV
jgi:hypothetical protein